MTSLVSALRCMPLLDCGTSLARLPPAASPALTCKAAPCPRHRPASRSGHPARPAALQALEVAARRGRAFKSVSISHRISNLTPGITRRHERLLEFENFRVGGRVHAVVMPPRLRKDSTTSVYCPSPPGRCLLTRVRRESAPSRTRNYTGHQ